MTLIPLIAGLLAGAIGWWITNFFLRPLQRIEDLRQRAHEELLIWDDVGPDSSYDDRVAARTALRQIAAGLIAAGENVAADTYSARILRIWLKRRRWNVSAGGTALLTHANTIGSPVQPDLKIVARDNLERALRLPSKYSDDVVLTSRDNLRVPAPH